MRYLFSRTSQTILERLANEKTLCALDFDGTLAPIVDHPDRAAMRAPTFTLLSQVCRLYPCVVVSGRARADLLRKLNGAAVTQAIGNHGAESGELDAVSVALVQGWKAAIEAQLNARPGVWVEDKGLSLAVHYRQNPRKGETRQHILESVGRLDGTHVTGGKDVVNVTMKDARNKGQALLDERERLGCEWALYVGDDDNDEDAFALRDAVVTVRVGRKSGSHAEYYLNDQAEIDLLLERLVALRQERLAGS